MCADKMRSNCGGDDYPATVVSFSFSLRRVAGMHSLAGCTVDLIEFKSKTEQGRTGHLVVFRPIQLNTITQLHKYMDNKINIVNLKTLIIHQRL